MTQIRFYGRAKGDPKYFPFSNFYHAPFTDNNGIIWPTTEHYFQAMKFLPEVLVPGMNHTGGKLQLTCRAWIHMQLTPALAAKEGRRRDLPLRKDWEEPATEFPIGYYNFLVKDRVMYDAISYKFIQHENLKQLLVETGDAEIIEDSPYDSYWGVGKYGNGKNMLGKLLMVLRNELRME